MLDELATMNQHFDADGNLSSIDRADDKRLLMEAKTVIDLALGRVNDFGTLLIQPQISPAMVSSTHQQSIHR